MRPSYLAQAGVLCALMLFLCCCEESAAPGRRRGTPIRGDQICDCKPSAISADDWRIAVKNVPIPGDVNPIDVTVKEILGWHQGTMPVATAPRSGKELQVYRIPRAYIQAAFLRDGDCDFDVEISEEVGKDAPRMVVEAPGMKEFCPARRDFILGLQRNGVMLTNWSTEFAQPIPAEITGLAFRDQWHPFWIPRASPRVKTLWELHPAVIRILPQAQ
jgi:hypothetical protein